MPELDIKGDAIFINDGRGNPPKEIPINSRDGRVALNELSVRFNIPYEEIQEWLENECPIEI